MAAGGMQYLIRTIEGNEYGPVEQETLMQWTTTGRVTPNCQIRNTLMKKWVPATEIAFLKDIFEEMVGEKDKGSALDKLSELKGGAENFGKAGLQSLTQAGKFKFTGARLTLRLGAWAFDILIVGLISIFLLSLAEQMTSGGDDIGYRNSIYTLVSVTIFLIYLMYLTVFMAFNAQTVGQWFWGIMVVRTEGGPVLMFRAFCFTLLHMLFWWSTFIFVFALPTRRGIQDKLSGVRVVKINVSDD
jgi:uncharacterized RDD family membrane protein YckC